MVASRILLPASGSSSKIAVFVCALVSVVSSSAATYYVSPSGNDAAPGSQTQPWRTIAKAATMMKAGDTSIVNAGTYNEKVSTARAGTASARITFRANGKAITKTFSINHDYVTIDGFEMTGAND